MAENKGNFYFNEVNIEYGENSHGLMEFELIAENVLKLLIDGRKNIDKSSIILSKKEIDFPEKIEWIIKNTFLYRIALKVEIKNKSDITIRQFWMTNYGLFNNQVTIYNIPKSTEKIVITCYHENVIDKEAVLTITANN